jgi:nicotinamidase-related amidase
MTTALLIVDIQNDYFPGGKMELVGSPQAAGQARKLPELFRSMDLPRIFIQHIATRPGASFFLPGTPGVDLHASIQPQAGETIIEKHFPNSFRETSLLAHLQQTGIRRLLICGMMTHMCIDATTRAAADLGFECLLAADACATRDLVFGGERVPAAAVHAAFLAALQGTYAAVKNTDEWIAQLL